jgi:hypothetical protein
MLNQVKSEKRKSLVGKTFSPLVAHVVYAVSIGFQTCLYQLLVPEEVYLLHYCRSMYHFCVVSSWHLIVHGYCTFWFYAARYFLYLVILICQEVHICLQPLLILFNVGELYFQMVFLRFLYLFFSLRYGIKRVRYTSSISRFCTCWSSKVKE